MPICVQGGGGGGSCYCVLHLKPQCSWIGSDVMPRQSHHWAKLQPCLLNGRMYMAVATSSPCTDGEEMSPQGLHRGMHSGGSPHHSMTLAKFPGSNPPTGWAGAPLIFPASSCDSLSPSPRPLFGLHHRLTCWSGAR